MTFTISFQKLPRKSTDTAVLLTYEDKKPTAKSVFSKKTQDFIAVAIKKSMKYEGKAGQSLNLQTPEDSQFGQIIIFGLGKKKELKPHISEILGGKLFQALKSAGTENAAILCDGVDPDGAAHLAMGAKLGSYSFTKYKTPKKEEPKGLQKVDIVSTQSAAIKKVYAPFEHVCVGIFTARDLVNEPPNHLYPDAYARFIQKELKPLGVEIEILDEKKMQKMGMGAILAVGMGSDFPPRMVVMRWNGSGKKSGKPLALVGKGVTFDTGGVSLKPAASMASMKLDMGGSAAVVGTMKALALRKSKADVVGIVGLAENMPSSKSYRPDDILKSYSGKTIEVLNTDAEGRLVLADALTYVQRTYKPCAVIDLATLTGAMMIALGHQYCGTFVNDDTLWNQMQKASDATGENLWRMPLDEEWKKDMESDVADVRNTAKSGSFAGACTAAGFLEHFIEDNTPWAHMDVAGVAWTKKDTPTVPKYGTGFGVRVLDRLISDAFEG